MNTIQLETIGTELKDKGMITKSIFDKNEMVGVHAYHPLNNKNHKAVTVFYHGDMELQARHGREKFATIRYSKEEMNDWLEVESEDDITDLNTII